MYSNVYYKKRTEAAYENYYIEIQNSEPFYITKCFINEKDVSTSSVVRKLGTLNDLLKDHGPTHDDVMEWVREQARLVQPLSGKALYPAGTAQFCTL